MKDLPEVETWLKTNGISLGIMLFITAFVCFILGLFAWQLAATGGLILVLGGVIMLVTALLRDV